MNHKRKIVRFEGKTAIITGATKGIGRAIAEMLIDEGLSVCISSRNKNEVERAVIELGSGARGDITGAVCDVRNYGEVKALVDHAVSELGGLDILVNNAGVGKFGRVDEMPPDVFREVLETNLFGVYYCCHEAIPHMKKRGGGS